MRHAHAIGNTLNAQVLFLLCVFLAQAQCINGTVGPGQFPVAARHWKDPFRWASKQTSTFGVCKALSCWQSAGIATSHTEKPMDEKLFDELAGRIDGIGQALLRLTAELEMQGIIDGPRVSAAWRRAAQPYTLDTAMHRSAYTTLQLLTKLLDDARSSRQSAPLPD